MASSTLLGLVLCCLVAFDAATATYEFVYEFGSKKGGLQVYEKESSIGLFAYFTAVPLHVPVNSKISYVKVTVWAISSPKVDFDEQTNTVSINYTWLQITMSSYTIFAKATPDESYD